MDKVYILGQGAEGDTGESLRAFLTQAEALSALRETVPESRQDYFFVEEVPIGPGKARIIAEKEGDLGVREFA